MDEVLASAQYLQRAKRAGYPFWDAFWGKKYMTDKVQ
jgi:hypothetical protein